MRAGTAVVNVAIVVVVVVVVVEVNITVVVLLPFSDPDEVPNDDCPFTFANEF